MPRIRKNYYVVKSEGGKIISKHIKLSAAKKAANKHNRARVYNQDGRAYY